MTNATSATRPAHNANANANAKGMGAPTPGPKRLYEASIIRPEHEDNETNFVDVLLIGEFGSGKTHLASTWPAPIFIDTDKGMRTVEKLHGEPIPGVRFSREDKVFRPLRQFLKDAGDRKGLFAPGQPWADRKSIILDGATALANRLLQEVVAEAYPGQPYEAVKPEFDQWGALSRRMEEIIDLLKQTPMHTVTTVMPRYEKDESKGVFVPAFNVVGGTRHIIGRLFDEVWYIEKRAVGKQPPKHIVYFNSYTGFPVKSRTFGSELAPQVNPTYDTLFGNTPAQTLTDDEPTKEPKE